MPSAPKASVAMPPHSSQASPKPADAPASGENSSVHRRSTRVDADLGQEREHAPPTGALAAA